MHVVGESYRQAELLELVEGHRGQFGHRLPVRAMLVAEPENKHDKNAVAVYAEGRDHHWRHVGYVDRERAAKFHQRLLRKGSVCCPAEARGGNVQDGEARHLGIVLYVRQAEI
jgi:hypothetical protein